MVGREFPNISGLEYEGEANAEEFIKVLSQVILSIRQAGGRKSVGPDKVIPEPNIDEPGDVIASIDALINTEPYKTDFKELHLAYIEGFKNAKSTDEKENCISTFIVNNSADLSILIGAVNNSKKQSEQTKTSPFKQIGEDLKKTLLSKQSGNVSLIEILKVQNVRRQFLIGAFTSQFRDSTTKEIIPTRLLNPFTSAQQIVLGARNLLLTLIDSPFAATTSAAIPIPRQIIKYAISIPLSVVAAVLDPLAKIDTYAKAIYNAGSNLFKAAGTRIRNLFGNKNRQEIETPETTNITPTEQSKLRAERNSEFSYSSTTAELSNQLSRSRSGSGSDTESSYSSAPPSPEILRKTQVSPTSSFKPEPEQELSYSPILGRKKEREQADTKPSTVTTTPTTPQQSAITTTGDDKPFRRSP